MLWRTPRGFWNLWDELDQLHSAMNRLYGDRSGRRALGPSEFPAVNIWTSDDQALLTAELPGIDPTDLDITVKNDTVTIRGQRAQEELKEGESYLRQERGAGFFVRTFSLPFAVESDAVKAHYQKGILQLTLPRAEADKPKKISVKAG